MNDGEFITLCRSFVIIIKWVAKIDACLLVLKKDNGNQKYTCLHGFFANHAGECQWSNSAEGEEENYVF